ncbi:Na+/H+ antiporter subunit E [Ramlibacter rhizophilus]|nr:Na+/H+ antiporter subunit E [Ramlibacter rhizophilus]
MSLLKRFLLMLALWLVLTQAEPGAWFMGLLAAALAAGLSMRILPPAPSAVSARRAVRLAGHFLSGSLRGGIDVARRAFDPRMPLRPGWIRHGLDLPPGPGRKLLGDLLTLMPGSMAAGDDGRSLLVHCLDTRQPVGSDIRALERLLRQTLGHEGEARRE